MRAGEIYRNKFEPSIRIEILWVKGDFCEWTPADEDSIAELYQTEYGKCLIKEVLELYYNEEFDD
jgi:hypothetical protein